MLLTLIILTLIQSLTSNGQDSLIDIPIKVPYENLIIQSTLTDNISGGDIFFMQEYISKLDSKTIQGKIVIESKTVSSEVHYSSDKNDQRLVLQETSCDLYTFKSKWDKNLPGVDKPLLNMLLLLGPSVLYRVSSGQFIWTPADDIDVRGIKMHGMKASRYPIDIKVYYKPYMTTEEGLLMPSRIIFSGYAPGEFWFQDEVLTLDIFLNEVTTDELDKTVQIPPGIGCPFYLSPNEPFPILSAHQFQGLIVETTNGPSSTSIRNEYYVDDDQAVIRLIQTTNGVKTDAIYDYNLGLIYVHTDTGCLVSPLGLTSPGINEKGYFSLNSLLWIEKSFHYLGQLDYKDQPGFRVKAWEITEHNTKISSKVYEKVVTTVYFVESRKSDIFINYVFVGASKNGYQKGSANDYLLIESVTRDLHDFKGVGSETEFEARFRVSDCYPDSKSRVELSFQLSCTYPKCYQMAEERSNEFRKIFKSTILNDRKISPVRISNIDMEFSPNSMNVIMTFTPGPDIEEPFRKEPMKVASTFLDKLTGRRTADETGCLKLEAALVAPIKTVLYCQTYLWNCYHLETTQEIPQDPNGITCDIWEFPLNNLYRVGLELSLEQIHQNMIDKSRYSSLRFYGYYYKVIDVIDITKAISPDELPFDISLYESKLNPDSNEFITVVSDATNFASCWRACVSEDKSLCETFSFCEYGDRIECTITSVMFQVARSNWTTSDEKCKVYSKNHLYDYHIIPSKRFKTPTSLEFASSAYDCATFCYASDSCYAFQYCGGYCTFADQFTDKRAENDENCDIYIPKVDQKYQIINEQTVVDIFHTQLGISIEQCAVLCDKWSSSDKDSCKSFNFCPKGRTSSSCYLSKYTVRDGETTHGDTTGCRNYELTANKNSPNADNNKNNANEKKSSTSLRSAFGIIVIFLTGGLIIGFLAPYGYKFYQTSPRFRSLLPIGRRTTTTVTSDTRFGWSKQVNDDDDDGGQSRI